MPRRLDPSGEAMPIKKRKIVDVKWASKREFDDMVELRARRVLKLSTGKFISNWKLGKYRKLDSDTCPGVVELAILAPLPRKKSARKDTKGRSGKLRKVSSRKS